MVTRIIATPLKGSALRMVGTSINIQRRKTDQEQAHDLCRQLEHLAHHDSLTNLPNRILFRDRLQQAIVKAKRNNTLVALCFIDLDNFKQINDRMGHDAGDFVLVKLAKRLQERMRAGDTTARIGGDEFMIILEQIKNHLSIRQII